MIDFISGGSAFPTVIYVPHSVIRGKRACGEIHVPYSSDQIVGVTVVASHAGEINLGVDHGDG